MKAVRRTMRWTREYGCEDWFGADCGYGVVLVMRNGSPVGILTYRLSPDGSRLERVSEVAFTKERTLEYARALARKQLDDLPEVL